MISWIQENLNISKWLRNLQLFNQKKRRKVVLQIILQPSGSINFNASYFIFIMQTKISTKIFYVCYNSHSKHIGCAKLHHTLFISLSNNLLENISILSCMKNLYRGSSIYVWLCSRKTRFKVKWCIKGNFSHRNTVITLRYILDVCADPPNLHLSPYNPKHIYTCNAQTTVKTKDKCLLFLTLDMD